MLYRKRLFDRVSVWQPKERTASASTSVASHCYMSKIPPVNNLAAINLTSSDHIELNEVLGFQLNLIDAKWLRNGLNTWPNGARLAKSRSHRQPGSAWILCWCHNFERKIKFYDNSARINYCKCMNLFTLISSVCALLAADTCSGLAFTFFGPVTLLLSSPDTGGGESWDCDTLLRFLRFLGLKGSAGRWHVAGLQLNSAS